MTDVIELTKNDIISLIDEIDAEISKAKETQPEEVIPGHDFYRAVMFAECIRCDNRYIDVEGCQYCQAGMDFLQKFRTVYPWKSDTKEADKKKRIEALLKKSA